MRTSAWWQAALLLGVGGTLFGAACGDDENGAGPDPKQRNTGDPCDTDAACFGGTECCFPNPEAATGVCQDNCSCIEHADCEGFFDAILLPGYLLPICCDGMCLTSVADTEGIPGFCLDSADCIAGRECVYYAEDDCFGECIEDGSGGSGGGGGAGGSGASGGSGGSGGGGPSVAAHTVINGEASIDGDGCLVTGGPGATPATILLDQTVSGPTTFEISGTMSPIVDGVGVEVASLVQLCATGNFTGTSVTDCPRARLEHNSAMNEAAAILLSTEFEEGDKLPWTPTVPVNDFSATVVTDPETQSMEIILVVNGVSVGAINATSLGPPGGDRVSLLVNQARICNFTVE